MKNKFKNIYFWLGLIAVFFAAAGIDVDTLTSWPLFKDAITSLLMNPVRLGAVFVALVGVFNDNSTKGLDKFR